MIKTKAVKRKQSFHSSKLWKKERSDDFAYAIKLKLIFFTFELTYVVGDDESDYGSRYNGTNGLSESAQSGDYACVIWSNTDCN